VWALSGADRSILAHLAAPAGFETFGSHVSGAGDVNRDGVGDFVIVAEEDFVGSIASEGARLYDGRTFQTLYTIEAPGFGASGAAVAGVPDVDGDRDDEFLVGLPFEGSGTATLYAGDDLFLDATPTTIGPDEDLDRIVRTGIPGKLALLALVAVNGVPTFLIVDGPRPLDGTGTLRSTVLIPPGLSGLSLGYQAFALNARGKLSKTAIESVDFE